MRIIFLANSIENMYLFDIKICYYLFGVEPK